MRTVRTTLCVLLVLGLTIAAPSCFADDPEPSDPTPTTTCVEVNPYNDPPVYTYECEDITDML